MSIRRATSSGLLPGRSLRTATPPWFAAGSSPVPFFESGFFQITTGSTANTKTAWSLVTSSTTDDCGIIMLSPGPANASADKGILFDVGVGASGQEVPIIQNLACGGYDSSFYLQFAVPVFIPAGSRIVARVQTATATQSVFPAVSLWKAAHLWQSPRSTDGSTPTPFVDVIGSSTSISRGTVLDTTANSYGTVITSATPRAYQALMIAPSSYGSTGINASGRLILGIGESGKERDIGGLYLQQTTGGIVRQNSAFAYMPQLIGVPIPAGTRIAIKHNFSANADRLQVCVIGVPYPTA